MRSIVESTKSTQTEVTHNVLSIVWKLVLVSALVIGLWAFACLVSALVSHGLTRLVRAYITAITGF